MVRSEGRVATERASRRLQQLCRHFARQTIVAHTPLRGQIVFPSGGCRLEARDDLLVVTLEADEAGALARLEDLLGRQLERFAVGEPPEIRWTGLEGLKF